MLNKLFLVIFISIEALASSDVKITKNVQKIYTLPIYHQFYYETIKPGMLINPRAEAIGLMGYKFIISYDSGIGLGLGTFGAFSGINGGYYGLGTILNFKVSLNDSWKLVPEIYGGISGGTDILNKNGIFIRPSIAVNYEIEGIGFFIGYSMFLYSENNKETHQPFFGINLDSDITLISKEYLDSLSGVLIKKSDWKWNIVNFMPYAKFVLTKNIPQISLKKSYLVLSGLRLNYYFHKYFLTACEVGGIINDEQNDFAIFLIGPGGFIPLFHGVSISPKIMLGFGGGGGIDSGGGAILDGGFELVNDFGMGIKGHILGGYLYSLTGMFRASYVGAALSLDFVSLERRKRVEKETVAVGANYDKNTFRFSLSSERHFLKNQYSSSKYPNGENLDLLGFNFDWFIFPFIYFNGGLYWPYSGIENPVHGSASIGLGFLSPSWKSFSIGLKSKLSSVPGDQIKSSRKVVFEIGGDINFAIEEESGVYLFLSMGKAWYLSKLDTYFGELGIRFVFDFPWRIRKAHLF